MKEYQISKKLTLQKETVATLDNLALDSVKGGTYLPANTILLYAHSEKAGNSCTCM